jgi:hypothetical protein
MVKRKYHSNGRSKSLSSKRRKDYLTLARTHDTLAPEATKRHPSTRVKTNAAGCFFHPNERACREATDISPTLCESVGHFRRLFPVRNSLKRNGFFFRNKNEEAVSKRPTVREAT